MYCPHEELGKLASFYAELNDYVSTARENSSDTLPRQDPLRRVTNAWLLYALLYQCGHVMQFEMHVTGNRVTAGNIMELIMGRALTTERFDVYDYLQNTHMSWFWPLKRCHAMNDNGPRWMTYEHPLKRPVVPPRLPTDPYPELMYDPSIPVVPVGELSKLTVKVLEQVQEHPFVLKGDAEKI